MRLLEKRGDTKELRNEAHRCEEAFRDAFVIRKLPAAQCAHFQVQLAQIQDCLGDIDSAIQLYQSAIDAGHPRVSQIHNSRAYLLEQKGDFVEALKEFDLAVSSDCPVSSLVLESRAKFKLRRGNIAGAKVI
jgi:tetratricopeptide (TPR) repeat protein